nr:integrase, catalytic region, zinc finger, CCHC-type, peptidase aspartic, catalytic [Tanacetum cinerariifolium]
MSNFSEDIQCAGSDTRPPTLDRTDFTSWKQWIRLYCRGKDSRVNILKSIEEGPYKLGTFRENLVESTEGTPQFIPERPRVYSDLNSKERDWYNADIEATNILLQGLPKDIYTLINHYTDAKDIWDNNSEYFKDKMLLMRAQENGVALDAEQLLFLAADPITDEAGPSYDSDILSEQCIIVLNDTFMMIYDDMCKPFAPSVSNSSRNAVVKNSLTAELATYREQVELYERRAKFELTEREQKINEQFRLVISDRNFKEETLKRELHSTKLQLTSTINRNKSMVEETTFLKQDFKQKENKLLADFLNMKSLKEKAQPALYNGHEILKDNHARAKVHNTEDTLEIAEITRKKMKAKMTDPECVAHKVKIEPHDYSKENLLAIFTPQKQLTPEQIYWSNDLMKLKS